MSPENTNQNPLEAGIPAPPKPAVEPNKPAVPAAPPAPVAPPSQPKATPPTPPTSLVPPVPGTPPKDILDTPNKEAEKKEGIAQNIVNLSTDKNKNKTILGSAPTLDADIIDRTFIKRKRLNLLYGIFAVLIILSGLSFGFFYSQLTPDFNLLGANLAQQTETSNQEIYRLQTEINEFNALTGQILINRFAFDGNRYQDFIEQIASPASSTDQKQFAQSQLPALKQNLIATISKVQKIFRRPTTVPVFSLEQEDPQSLEREFIRQAKAKIIASAQRFQNTPDEKDNLNLYRNAANLIGNQNLNRTIKSANIENISQNDEQLNELITNINSQAKNEFSIVNSLKNQRVKWEEVLTNIINSTKQAEQGLIVANEGTYQMQLYTAGGTTSILYSSYTIDAENGRISVAGNLKTPDETTFSTMANLIESFESSPYFSDVDYRSFNKSGSSSEGYESSFRIDFFIQEDLLEDTENQSEQSS